MIFINKITVTKPSGWCRTLNLAFSIGYDTEKLGIVIYARLLWSPWLINSIKWQPGSTVARSQQSFFYKLIGRTIGEIWKSSCILIDVVLAQRLFQCSPWKRAEIIMAMFGAELRSSWLFSGQSWDHRGYVRDTAEIIVAMFGAELRSSWQCSGQSWDHRGYVRGRAEIIMAMFGTKLRSSWLWSGQSWDHHKSFGNELRSSWQGSRQRWNHHDNDGDKNEVTLTLCP